MAGSGLAGSFNDASDLQAELRDKTFRCLSANARVDVQLSNTRTVQTIDSAIQIVQSAS